MEFRTDEPRPKERRPYRPPIGIPGHAEPRAQATVASFVVHALVILLILAPTIFVGTQLMNIENRGGGGAGPVGGGGGGTRGTGGNQGLDYVHEGLRYFSLPRPTPPPKAQKEEKPVVKPPEPKKEEEKPKPPEPPKPEPPPETRTVQATDSVASVAEAGATAGNGGGTGKDGTAGSGPGRGGGVGSGVGTGRGSGIGPGTGGGDEEAYPPTVVSMPILPLPVPGKVRPYKMVAYFEVDTTGAARLLSFNPSKDAGYNKRIREMLMEIRFRPAVRTNGIAIKDTAVVTAEAM
jgi:protein TonB